MRLNCLFPAKTLLSGILIEIYLAQLVSTQSNVKHVQL